MTRGRQHVAGLREHNAPEAAAPAETIRSVVEAYIEMRDARYNALRWGGGGPHKDMWQEPQRRLGVGMPLERLDSAEQAARYIGAGDRRPVDGLGHNERAAKIGGNVAFGAGRYYGVAENLAASAAKPLRCLVAAVTPSCGASPKARARR